MSRYRPLPQRAAIARALRAAAASEGCGRATVGVLVCGDDEIRGLNLRFAGEDHATDVLSFTADGVDEAGRRQLGDIVLSLDHLRRQAESAGHSVEREAATLTVHGFLHLLGHDHAEPEAATAMFARTDAILAAAGLL